MKSVIHRNHHDSTPDPEAAIGYRVLLWIVAVAGVVVIFW